MSFRPKLGRVKFLKVRLCLGKRAPGAWMQRGAMVKVCVTDRVKVYDYDKSL
jgi:hypothetical protein